MSKVDISHSLTIETHSLLGFELTIDDFEGEHYHYMSKDEALILANFILENQETSK